MSSMIKGLAGYQEGRAQEYNEKMIRHQEAQAKEDRELQRARELKRVLAANRASAGARGIAVGIGSERAISDYNFQKFDEDQAVDSRDTAFRISSSKMRGRLAKRGANMSLAAGIAGTAETAMMGGG